MGALEHWEDALSRSGMDDKEIAQRRSVLEEFCAFAQLEPDEVVEGCVDRERGRIVAKGRRRVEDLLDEFASAAGDGNARSATERANVVRSFLIHNGVRVLAPKAPWL